MPLNSVGRPCAGDLVRFLHSSSVHCVVDGWNLEKADMSASPICLFIYLFISSDFPIGWVCLLVAIGLLSVSLDESSSSLCRARARVRDQAQAVRSGCPVHGLFLQQS